MTWFWIIWRCLFGIYICHVINVLELQFVLRIETYIKRRRCGTETRYHYVASWDKILFMWKGLFALLSAKQLILFLTLDFFHILYLLIVFPMKLGEVKFNLELIIYEWNLLYI